jgi:hypothetical protein
VLYDSWDQPRDWSGWIDYAWEARRLLKATGAQALMFAAIDASVVSGGCSKQSLAGLAVAADAMALAPTQTEMAPKARWIHALVDDRAQCSAFRATWLAAHPW